MNKIRINSVLIVFFFFLGLNYSYADFGCECDTSPDGTQFGWEYLNYPNAKSCYDDPIRQCGGIPINENAYLLIVLGGILVFTVGYFAKNKKLISSKYLSNKIKNTKNII